MPVARRKSKSKSTSAESNAADADRSIDELYVACDHSDAVNHLTLSDYIFIMLWLGWLGFVPALFVALVVFFLYRDTISIYPFLIILVPVMSSIVYPLKLEMQPKIGFELGKKIMHAASRYFGLRLVYTDKLAVQESGPGIFNIEPHDVMPLALFCFSDYLGHNTGHKNVGCLSGICFLIPLMKHVYTWASAQSVSKSNVKRLMDQGYSPTICPGGVQEVTMMSKDQKQCILFLKSRQGTVRLAMSYGRPIIPVFVFGQRATYSFNILENSFAQWLGRKIGFAPMMFYGLWGIPFAIPKPCTFLLPYL
jgi:2-acylglycerol O-acyltransferase 2